MIAFAAEESGLAKEFISNINTEDPGALHHLYLSAEPVQDAIIAQEKIIRKIADAGSCVIVGRIEKSKRPRPVVWLTFAAD
jgi:hypothetical protein